MQSHVCCPERKHKDYAKSICEGKLRNALFNFDEGNDLGR